MRVQFYGKLAGWLGKDVEIEGTMDELNLRSGANRIRAIRNGLRSNVFVDIP